MVDEKRVELGELYYWRGVSLDQAGRHDLGIQDREKADELGYRSVEMYRNLGYSYRGKADQAEDGEEKDRLYLRAAEWFTRAIELQEEEM